MQETTKPRLASKTIRNTLYGVLAQVVAFATVIIQQMGIPSPDHDTSTVAGQIVWLLSVGIAIYASFRAIKARIEASQRVDDRWTE